MFLRRNHRAQLALLLLLIIFPPLATVAMAQPQPTEAQLKGFHEYADKAGRDWKVPGFSVAIVKDDKVIFARGFGIRELGKFGEVDERTLFAIASNSKAFTAGAQYKAFTPALRLCRNIHRSDVW